MPEIILATLNAKYIHSAFGLRYLFANLGCLRPRASILEFDISQRPIEIAEKILAGQPRVLGLGVYIWNAVETCELVAILKALRPELAIVLGGPEVSYETEEQEICRLADYAITGEADLEFRSLCELLLSGERPPEKIRRAALPDFGQLELPYAFYSDADIAHRLIYVEASRGCPFSCEFCLSSLDIPVRQAPLQPFLAALRGLFSRGVTHLKFVDRTFNLNLPTSLAILAFLEECYRPGHFYHFEMVPDRLPEGLRKAIKGFPPGALQFEVGIQTFNEEVAERISRRQNYARLSENLQFLRSETGVHVHGDLIFGLPGESLGSFAAGFDRLIALHPNEIQLGMLKRLRGTPIARHTDEWQVVYSPLPPYEILQNKLLPFSTVQEMRRFARYWDLLGNSGNFIESTPLICNPGSGGSPFARFLAFSRWLYAETGRTDSISLMKLMELVFKYLTLEANADPRVAAAVLWRDYQRGGRSDKPGFLKEYLPEIAAVESKKAALPKRQARHVAR